MKKAVALKYPEGAPSPFITASARGEAAERLAEIAKESGIAVVENANLADVLTLGEIGSYVPEETWGVLAGIFAFVLQAQAKKR